MAASDDERIVGEFEPGGGFGQAVGAGRVVGAGHARGEPVRDDGRAHALVVGGDDDLVGARGERPLRDAHDHRLAADVRQRLSRQPRRRMAGRDQDGEAHAGSASISSGVSLRASSSSITGMPSRTG